MRPASRSGRHSRDRAADAADRDWARHTLRETGSPGSHCSRKPRELYRPQPQFAAHAPRSAFAPQGGGGGGGTHCGATGYPYGDDDDGGPNCVPVCQRVEGGGVYGGTAATAPQFHSRPTSKLWLRLGTLIFSNSLRKVTSLMPL